MYLLAVYVICSCCYCDDLRGSFSLAQHVCLRGQVHLTLPFLPDLPFQPPLFSMLLHILLQGHTDSRWTSACMVTHQTILPFSLCSQWFVYLPPCFLVYANLLQSCILCSHLLVSSLICLLYNPLPLPPNPFTHPLTVDTVYCRTAALTLVEFVESVTGDATPCDCNLDWHPTGWHPPGLAVHCFDLQGFRSVSVSCMLHALGPVPMFTAQPG